MSKWSCQCLCNDCCTSLLVTFQCIDQSIQLLRSMDICRSTTCDDTLFYGCSCSVQSIFQTKLCFLHLCLSCSTNTDNCDTTSKLCQSLLQFLLIELRCCLSKLCLNHINSCLDICLCTTTINDNCILLGNLDALCTSKLIQSCLLQIIAKLLRDHCTTCQDCDILQHLFSSVTIARCLYTYD